MVDLYVKASANGNFVPLRAATGINGALRTSESGVTKHKEFLSLSAHKPNAVTANGDVRLMGYSSREAAGGGGGTAAFYLKEGALATASNTEVLAVAEFSAKESHQAWYGPRGIEANDGVSITVLDGTLDVILYFHKDD